jgi:hypothetical protein
MLNLDVISVKHSKCGVNTLLTLLPSELDDKLDVQISYHSLVEQACQY